MNKLRKDVLLILVTLVISSCVVFPDKVTPDLHSEATDVLLAAVPSQTSEPTNPPASPALTATVTPIVATATPTWESPLPDIEVKSIEVMTSSLEIGQAKGTFAYLDYSDSKQYLLNLATGEKTLLFAQDRLSLYCGPVSPDRSRLACHAGDQLLLFDWQAQILDHFPWQEGWVYNAGWVNNTWLAFVTRPPQDYPNLLNVPTTLLNLTTQETRQIIPDYPNITVFEPFGNFGPLAFTGVSYGPDLELVVYEAYESGDFAWVLWDRKAQQEKARIPQSEQYPYPQWSPDGQQVVVAGSDESYTRKQSATELYLLSRLNGVQKLTHLGDSFLNFTEIWGLGWSPDGKQIAFVLQSDQSACSLSGCIGVINVDTKKLNLFRFRQYGISFPDEPTYNLTWSPDGRQLLLELFSEVTQSTSITIFNFETETAFPVITTEVRILGWMSEK